MRKYSHLLQYYGISLTGNEPAIFLSSMLLSKKLRGRFRLRASEEKIYLFTDAGNISSSRSSISPQKERSFSLSKNSIAVEALSLTGSRATALFCLSCSGEAKLVLKDSERILKNFKCLFDEPGLFSQLTAMFDCVMHCSDMRGPCIARMEVDSVY